MPIKSADGDAYYVLPNNREIVEKSRRLVSVFFKFVDKLVGEGRFESKGLVSNIVVQRALIRDAVVRVDKRIVDFRIFHGIHPNEIKEAALYAYWILKFRPFMVSGSLLLEKELETLNERFALFLILCACEAVAIRQGKNTINGRISEKLKAEIIYAFQYQDLSKESVILIAETIAERILNPETKEPVKSLSDLQPVEPEVFIGLKVFISYAWDDEAFERWVAEFVEGLKLGGINVKIDWDVPCGSDFIQFMNDGIKGSDKVLVIATRKYNEKLKNGKSKGVKWECSLITEEIYNNSDTTKFIPIKMEKDFDFSDIAIPGLGTKKGFDFSNEKKYDETMKELVESLKKAWKFGEEKK